MICISTPSEYGRRSSVPTTARVFHDSSGVHHNAAKTPQEQLEKHDKGPTILEAHPSRGAILVQDKVGVHNVMAGGFNVAADQCNITYMGCEGFLINQKRAFGPDVERV